MFNYNLYSRNIRQHCLTLAKIADRADLHVNNKIGYVGSVKTAYDKSKTQDGTMYQSKGQKEVLLRKRHWRGSQVRM